MRYCKSCGRFVEAREWAGICCVQCETSQQCPECGRVVPRVEWLEARGMCIDCTREADCRRAFARRMSEEVEA